VLRAALKYSSTPLESLSVVVINVELDIPDWKRIRDELRNLRSRNGPTRLQDSVPTERERLEGYRCDGGEATEGDAKKDRPQGVARLGKSTYSTNEKATSARSETHQARSRDEDEDI
jgi:hypothetical protein